MTFVTKKDLKTVLGMTKTELEQYATIRDLVYQIYEDDDKRYELTSEGKLNSMIISFKNNKVVAATMG